jgi:hypothetical protein
MARASLSGSPPLGFKTVKLHDEQNNKNAVVIPRIALMAAGFGGLTWLK